MKKIVRPGTVCANRHSGGNAHEGFCLQVIDDETSACVEVWFTPEQWALSMWGRGDIPVQVSWIDLTSREITSPEMQMLAQAAEWERAANQAGLSEIEHERYMAKAEALRDFASDLA